MCTALTKNLLAIYITHSLLILFLFNHNYNIHGCIWYFFLLSSDLTWAKVAWFILQWHFIVRNKNYLKLLKSGRKSGAKCRSVIQTYLKHCNITKHKTKQLISYHKTNHEHWIEELVIVYQCDCHIEDNDKLLNPPFILFKS